MLRKWRERRIEKITCDSFRRGSLEELESEGLKNRIIFYDESKRRVFVTSIGYYRKQF